MTDPRWLLIAIIIVCLASFRALFVKQEQRKKAADYRSGWNLLPGSSSIKKVGTMVFFGSHSWSSPSKLSSNGGKNEPLASQEAIIPPGRVLVSNEIHMSSMDNPRAGEV